MFFQGDVPDNFNKYSFLSDATNDYLSDCKFQLKIHSSTPKQKLRVHAYQKHFSILHQYPMQYYNDIKNFNLKYSFLLPKQMITLQLNPIQNQLLKFSYSLKLFQTKYLAFQIIKTKDKLENNQVECGLQYKYNSENLMYRVQFLRKINLNHQNVQEKTQNTVNYEFLYQQRFANNNLIKFGGLIKRKPLQLSVDSQNAYMQLSLTSHNIFIGYVVNQAEPNNEKQQTPKKKDIIVSYNKQWKNEENLIDSQYQVSLSHCFNNKAYLISMIYEFFLRRNLQIKNIINSEYQLATIIKCKPTSYLTIMEQSQINLKKLVKEGDEYKFGFGFQIDL